MTSTSSTVRPGRGRRCRGDAFPCRFSVIQSACLHRRFVITTTDRDASAGFFHRRSTSRVLGPYNRLCAIHLAPVTSIAEYYAHLLRATGLLACCRVASSGCSTAARVSASPLHLHHRPLCIDDCTAHSLLRHPSAQGLRPADWVFVIELPLPAPSLSHARRSHPSHRR